MNKNMIQCNLKLKRTLGLHVKIDNGQTFKTLPYTDACLESSQIPKMDKY